MPTDGEIWLQEETLICRVWYNHHWHFVPQCNHEENICSSLCIMLD